MVTFHIVVTTSTGRYHGWLLVESGSETMTVAAVFASSSTLGGLTTSKPEDCGLRVSEDHHERTPELQVDTMPFRDIADRRGAAVGNESGTD